MPESRKIGMPIYAFTRDLIDAACMAVNFNPGDVGVYYAEKLEQAAKKIREANEIIRRNTEKMEQAVRQINNMPCRKA